MKKTLLLTLSFLLLSQSGSFSKNNLIQKDHLAAMFQACNLNGILSFELFRKSVAGFLRYKPKKSILTIVDFSLPSDQKRFFVIDLEQQKLLLSTWVAHGKNSGMLMANAFSNKVNSYQSSPGFYMVGPAITSPKHGKAIELIGLEKGLNDNAQKREIILHGASYVGEKFVKENGRCGRSHGCPAIPVELMTSVSPILSNGSLLYIFTNTHPTIEKGAIQ